MNSILRIIDANFNRAREGLRVVEDGIRFYYNLDRSLIKKIKDIRHSLSITVDKYFGLFKIKKGRDTAGDKGKNLDTRTKEDITGLIERNLMRVSEALRVMEEYSRTFLPSASAAFHNLRFKLYEIEKELILSLHKKDIPEPFISVLLNIGIKPSLSDVEKIIDSRPDILILSYSGSDTRYFLNTAKRIRNLLPPSIIYLICGRPDICLLSDADGIFLKGKDIPSREAKKILQGMVVLTEKQKKVNIFPLECNTILNFKESLIKDIRGIILKIEKEIPDNIKEIIRMIKNRCHYVRRRKEKTTGKK